MADKPGSLSEFVTKPWPNDEDPPDEATMRLFTRAVASILGASPTDLRAYAGQLVVVKSDGTGITPIGAGGLSVLDLGGSPVVRSPSRGLTITGSKTLTSVGTGVDKDFGQDGALLYCNSASAITLTIALDSTGKTGIRQDFACAVYRRGAGIVQLGPMPSGVTLVAETGHTKVKAGPAPALITLHDGVLSFYGATEA